MKIDFSEQKPSASYVSAYTRGGASPAYALPVAKVAVERWELFSHVTGATLALLEHEGVPASYAVAAFAAGFKTFEVIRLWNDGIPQEYVTAGGGKG